MQLTQTLIAQIVKVINWDCADFASENTDNADKQDISTINSAVQQFETDNNVVQLQHTVVALDTFTREYFENTLVILQHATDCTADLHCSCLYDVNVL
tara:strand:- start:1719 stop:2012 length:294 start_codon:yes stop_codon:yes gene_type:complete